MRTITRAHNHVFPRGENRSCYWEGSKSLKGLCLCRLFSPSVQPYNQACFYLASSELAYFNWLGTASLVWIIVSQSVPQLHLEEDMGMRLSWKILVWCRICWATVWLWAWVSSLDNVKHVYCGPFRCVVHWACPLYLPLCKAKSCDSENLDHVKVSPLL